MKIRFIDDVVVTLVRISHNIDECIDNIIIRIKKGATPTINRVERGEKRKSTRLNKLYVDTDQYAFCYLDNVPENSYEILNEEDN